MLISLAVAQVVFSEPTQDPNLAPLVLENGRVLLRS
jgi:hypothetical protein